MAEKTPLVHQDIGRGVDQLHPETKLNDGYWEDIRNGDPTPQGTLQKRTGYQLFSGTLPVRVTSIKKESDIITLTTDVQFVGIQPIIIRGASLIADDSMFDSTMKSVSLDITKIERPTTSSLTFEDTVSGADYLDTNPNMVIWGIRRESIISDSTVNFIDTYRAQLESYPVAGVGGYLYASHLASDLDSSSYKITSTNMANTIETANNLTLAPCFWETGETPTRGRKYLTFETAGTNRAIINQVEFMEPGKVKLHLQTPGLQEGGTGGDAIVPGEDMVTITDVSSILNGTHDIESYSYGTDTMELVCLIPKALEEKQITDAGEFGYASILTDIFPDVASMAIPHGATLSLMPTGEEFPIVKGTSTSTMIIVGEEVLLPVGVYCINCTGSVIPVEYDADNDDPSRIIAGDYLSVGGVQVRAVTGSMGYGYTLTDIQPLDAGRVLATLNHHTEAAGSQASSPYFAGDKIAVYGGLVGEVEIESIQLTSTTTSEVVLLTDQEPTDVTASLYHSFYVDQVVPIGANNGIETTRRWVPIDAPSNQFGKQMDDKDPIRSSMAQDNLYIANYNTPLMKYDGRQISRAGLLPWTPVLFATHYPSANGIQSETNPVETLSKDGQVFEVGAGEEKLLTPGDRVGVTLVTNSTGIPLYNHEEDLTSVAGTSDAKVSMKEILFHGGGSGDGESKNIYKQVVLKYYARLNVVDANRNIIASAYTYSEDLNIVITARASVQLTILNPPLMNLQDGSSLEVEIYRTGGENGLPPYYKLTSFKVDPTVEQIQFTDNTPPRLFPTNQGNADPTAVLTGGELGNNWDRPPLAKFVSSLDGRLVLGNIKSYNKLDISFRKPSTVNTLTNILLNGVEFTIDGDVYRAVSSVGAGSLTKNTEDGYLNVSVTAPSTGWVYIHHLGGRTLRSDASQYSDRLAGWYKLLGSSSPYKIKVDGAKAAVDITSHTAGSSTMTVASTSTLVTGEIASIEGSGTYYIRVMSSTTFQLYNTNNDALTNQNAISFVSSQAGKWLSPGLRVRSIGSVNAGVVPIYMEQILGSVGRDTNYSMATSQVERMDYKGNRELDLARRLADAINSVQRKRAGGAKIFARAGNDFGIGQIILESIEPDYEFDFSYSLGSTGQLDVYANQIYLPPGDEVSSSVRVYPSRLVKSYRNYPEIFDAPYAESPLYSDSIIDINPSDGEQVTGYIPFFGDSAFGTASKEQLLLVFKERSVYIVNVETGLVQKLETNGQGCTYPRSIAATKHGIMFANESGLYKINRSLELVYLGQIITRKWKERLQIEDTSIPAATHNYLQNKYILSYPTENGTVCDLGFVYDHTREHADNQGSWTFYENIPASGWANWASFSLFSSNKRSVYVRRDTGTKYDYKDDTGPVKFSGVYKALNFGVSGLRKLLSNILVTYRLSAPMRGTRVYASADNLQAFQTTDKFELLDVATPSPTEVSDNLSDKYQAANPSIGYTPKVRKGQWLQLRIENDKVDEPVEITELEFEVSPLESGKGIKQARE